MDVDKIRVVIDGDYSPLTRAFKGASSEAKSFESNITAIGTSSEKSSAKGQAAFSKLGSSIRDAKSEARDGIDLPVRVDTSQLNTARGMISGFRQEVSRGETFRIDADTSGLAGIASEVQAIRFQTGQDTVMRVTGDTTGLAGVASEVQAIRSQTSQDAVMRVTAETSGISGATAEVEAFKGVTAEADDTIHVDADFDGAGATAGIAAFSGAAKSGSSAADTFNRSALPITGQMGLIAVAAVEAAAALNPVLGALATVGALGASAAGGFGLIGAAAVSLGAQLTDLSSANDKVETATKAVAVAQAIYDEALASGDEAAIKDARKDLSTATDNLTKAQTGLNIEMSKHSSAVNTLFTDYQSFKSAAADAFAPAADSLASLGSRILELAEGQLPLLGSIAEANMGAFGTAVDEVIAKFQEPIEQSNLFAIIKTMPDVVGNITTAAGDAGLGLLNMFSIGAPSADTLSAKISSIAEGFLSWTESDDARTRIQSWIDTATTTFGELWTQTQNIAGALENFSDEHPEEVRKSIEGIGTAITDVITLAGAAATAIEKLDTASEFSSGVGEAGAEKFGTKEKFEALKKDLSEGDWFTLNKKGMSDEKGTNLGSLLFGDDAVGTVLAKVKESYQGVIDWLSGVVPETTLWKVVTGDMGGEGEDSGSVVSGITDRLKSAYDGVTGWLGGLVPDLTLMDVIMDPAGATGEIGASLISTHLQPAWDSAMEWLGGLVPDLSLLDVLVNPSAAAGGVGDFVATNLQPLWDSAMEWLGGLVPDVSFIDMLLGGPTAIASEFVATHLQPLWDSAMEWLGSLVPDISLTDIITGAGDAVTDNPIVTTVSGWWDGFTAWWEGLDFGSLMTSFSEGFTSGFETVTTTVSEFFEGLYNDYFLAYLGPDGTIATTVSEFFTSLIETYWTPYFGSDGLLITGVSDFFTSLIETYWTPYFGSDGLLITGISEFFTSLVETYWTPYFGADGLLITGISEFFTSLIETYWTPYFGSDGLLVTGVSDFFTSLVDTYWTPYFGSDGLLITAVGDFFTSLVDTYWTPYFGTDGSLITPISEFFTSLYNDYFLYYLGPDGVVVTAVSDAWTAITEGVTSFVQEFGDTLANGIAKGVNAAIGFMQGLLDAVDKVLTAIGASTLGVTLPTVSVSDSGFSAARDGLVTDSMARGGNSARGGAGTQGKQSRLIEWNEQANGREWWIATGSSHRRANEKYLAGAAKDMGYGVVPMANGGYMSAAGPVVKADSGLWSADVEPIVQDIQSKFGVNATTYPGHGALHLYPNVETNVADFWTDDPALHAAMWDYIMSTYGSVLDTMISQGQLVGPGGSMPDPAGDHYDHLHAGFYGAGGPAVGGGTIGSLISGLIETAKSTWSGLLSILGDPSLGSGPLWDGVSSFLKKIPEMAWQYITANMPAGRIGGGPIDLSSIGSGVEDAVKAGLEQMGWGADQLSALTELWMGESGWDASAVNPDSGAYGIPQINPGAHGYPAPIGDAIGQIEWGLQYIADRYGTPADALAHWTDFGSYATGGVVGQGSTGSLYRASNSSLYTQTSGLHIGNKRPTGSGVPRSGDATQYQPPKGKRNTSQREHDSHGMYFGGLLGMKRGGRISSKPSRQNIVTDDPNAMISEVNDTGSGFKIRPRQRGGRRGGTRSTSGTRGTAIDPVTGQPITGSARRPSSTSQSSTSNWYYNIDKVNSRKDQITTTTRGGTRDSTTSSVMPSGTILGGKRSKKGTSRIPGQTDTSTPTDLGATDSTSPPTSTDPSTDPSTDTTTTDTMSKKDQRKEQRKAKRIAKREARREKNKAKHKAPEKAFKQPEETPAELKLPPNPLSIRKSDPSYIQAAMARASARSIYHAGGVVPGITGSTGLAFVGAGERILPPSVNQNFESWVNQLASWNPSAGSRDDFERGAGDKLDAILQAIEHGNRNPTPVDINNVDDLKVAQLTMALSAIDSDAGMEIIDSALAEAINHRMEMKGRAT